MKYQMSIKTASYGRKIILLTQRRKCVKIWAKESESVSWIGKDYIGGERKKKLLPEGHIVTFMFGVVGSCEKCGRCAQSCHAGATTAGSRTSEALSLSNNPGVLKWPLHAEKCLHYWRINGMGCASCVIPISVRNETQLEALAATPAYAGAVAQSVGATPASPSAE
jgi:ferredoxin